MTRGPQVLRVFWRGPRLIKVWEPLFQVILTSLAMIRQSWGEQPDNTPPIFSKTCSLVSSVEYINSVRPCLLSKIKLWFMVLYNENVQMRISIMSSRELFISSPRCTCADTSDYVRSLLCATFLVGSVAVHCWSLTSFITQASSKPSLDLFPRKCTYAKVIDLRNMILWSIGLQTSHSPSPNQPVSATGCQFPNLCTKRNNQQALQFWRVVNSLKTWKITKRKREAASICPVCPVVGNSGPGC